MRIKEMRMQRGISQRDLAEALGIAPNTLSQYETEKREPDISILTRLADYFGVTVDYLINHKKGDLTMSEKLCTFFRRDGWLDSELEDFNKLKSDGDRRDFLAHCGYDESHRYIAERLFPEQFQEESATSLKESESPVYKITADEFNIVAAYRQAVPADRQIIDNIVERYSPSTAGNAAKNKVG